MKSFETLLQNACEDYFSQFDREPTLTDIAEVCTTPIANVIWKAVRVASENIRNKPLKETRKINGVPLDKVKLYFSQTCQSLLGKEVGKHINLLKYLFKLCPTYGFEFHYGTRDGLHEKLEHTYDDNSIIVGAGFSKNKK